MSKNKLYKFAEFESFPNTQTDPKALKGQWENVFKNKNPITLELACGRGEYTVEMALKYNHRNFIGADKKGARLWSGAKKSLEIHLDNVIFIRIFIEKLLDYFGPNEIDEIWIPFPDPFPKKGKAKKRLTSPRFINIYRQISTPSTLVHFKTDNDLLYQSTLASIKETSCKIIHHIPDLYSKPVDPLSDLSIQTRYEKRHLNEGKTIKYICFALF